MSPACAILGPKENPQHELGDFRKLWGFREATRDLESLAVPLKRDLSS